ITARDVFSDAAITISAQLHATVRLEFDGVAVRCAGNDAFAGRFGALPRPHTARRRGVVARLHRRWHHDRSDRWKRSLRSRVIRGTARLQRCSQKKNQRKTEQRERAPDDRPKTRSWSGWRSQIVVTQSIGKRSRR